MQWHSILFLARWAMQFATVLTVSFNQKQGVRICGRLIGTDVSQTTLCQTSPWL